MAETVADISENSTTIPDIVPTIPENVTEEVPAPADIRPKTQDQRPTMGQQGRQATHQTCASGRKARGRARSASRASGARSDKDGAIRRAGRGAPDEEPSHLAPRSRAGIIHRAAQDGTGQASALRGPPRAEPQLVIKSNGRQTLRGATAQRGSDHPGRVAQRALPQRRPEHEGGAGEAHGTYGRLRSLARCAGTTALHGGSTSCTRRL